MVFKSFLRNTYNILNYRVFKVTQTTANTFQLSIVNSDGSLSSVNFNTFGAPYVGTGKIEIINNFLVRTKRFTPFIAGESGIRINYFDMFLKRADGSFLTEILSDQDSTRAVRTSNVSSEDEVFFGLSPEKIWKRIFANTIRMLMSIIARITGSNCTIARAHLILSLYLVPQISR